MTFLEAVASAISDGKTKICVVCDVSREKSPLIERLEKAFGPVPMLDYDCRGREPGIWDLAGPDPKVHFANWASALAGRGFDAIVAVNRPAMESIHGMECVKEWILVTLKNRLCRGGWFEEVEEVI